MRAYQHLKADNDPNGNPQRLYVVYELQTMPPSEGLGYWTIVEVYDEGYAGLPQALHGMPQLPDVSIRRSDYHSRYNMAKGAGLLRYGS
jgi:hypothetical protein